MVAVPESIEEFNARMAEGPRCEWCGEFMAGEDRGFVRSTPDAMPQTFEVHAEPCYTEAIAAGWEPA